MFIGTKEHIAQIPKNTHIHVGNSTIVPTSSMKNLGVCFDNCLQFDSHISHMCKKGIDKLMYVIRIKDNFDKQSRVTVI